MTRPALRSKQVRAAKAVGSGLTYTEAGAIVGRSKRTITRWLQDPELRLIAEREDAVPGEVAPVEMLHTALHATKANGQPDWGTPWGVKTRIGLANELISRRSRVLKPHRRLYLTYEWTSPLMTEFGYGPESDFRLESAPFNAHGDVLVVVHSEIAAAPRATERTAALVAELCDVGVERALVLFRPPALAAAELPLDRPCNRHTFLIGAH